MKAGDRVELRSANEILATLDDQGCLDGVPFMPEMLGFFGRPFTVEAQVGRACDTVSYSGVRRLPDTVILDDLRCDGAGHAGCQAQCRLYWKEAWLRQLDSPEGRTEPATRDGAFTQLEHLVTSSVHATNSTAEPRYRCQATELFRASEPVAWWSARSFMHELTGGNVGLWRFIRVMTRIVVEEMGRRLGRVSEYPLRPEGMIGSGLAAPASRALRPGELVQVRSREEIGKTLDEKGKNRGLWFDREMQVYCGRRARVRTKVEHFIDERDGRLVELASDCYILDNVVCESYRSSGRWFCPRAIYPWWREAWLERLEEDASPSAGTEAG